jgi:hypothetical protein
MFAYYVPLSYDFDLPIVSILSDYELIVELMK